MTQAARRARKVKQEAAEKQESWLWDRAAQPPRKSLRDSEAIAVTSDRQWEEAEEDSVSKMLRG